MSVVMSNAIKKIVVYNLGCKVNQYEADSLVKALLAKGFEVSENLEFADCYIINTCAVTNEAERKSRQCVARCLKFNASAKVLVCGCASQFNSKQFATKPNVTFVKGVFSKMDLVNKIDSFGVEITPPQCVYEDNLFSQNTRNRAYVKIQDGCNNFCSYCLIPYLRGRSRSRSIASVVEECQQQQKVASEIVLIGIDISSYGKDFDAGIADLFVALKDINARIRLGSLEASLIDDAFLSSLSNLKCFCPHFHLSLQSGCDDVLKAMNRHYTAQEYFQKVCLIRKYFPMAAITTDLICGYPTENQQNFEQTLQFIKKAQFADMHIFGYSKREGTKASKLKVLPKEILIERCAKAEQVAKVMRQDYLKKFVNLNLSVLIEEEIDGIMQGYSENYIRVSVVGNAKINEVVTVKILDFSADCVLKGEVINE
ncbi:MAG: tRNA (N(6)-L-threonylcarbamoyladenosine(37)-C(2))-methylthiotransferase MtaB [Clostridia bacterium]